MSSLRHWVWLSLIRGLSTVKKHGLLERFGSAGALYFAGEREYSAVPGLRQSEVAALCKKDASAAAGVIDLCAEKGIRIVTVSDSAYPERLRNIPDPPVLLYVRGRALDFDSNAVLGIVGTRKSTVYGNMVAERLGRQLASGGATVVSGGARGIDSCALKGALAEGGTAVAVLGCGADVAYPRENAGLFEDIAERGAIISEYPPGTEALPRHFPARNRIVSGLSIGIIVVEAPKKSGALITAACAADQGRDVFAVPGNINLPTFEGTNDLIRDGAYMVSTGADVLERYVYQFPGRLDVKNAAKAVNICFAEAKAPAPKAERIDESPAKADKKVIDKPESIEYIDLKEIEADLKPGEAAVFRLLSDGPKNADELAVGAGLRIPEVLMALTIGQIKGYVEELPGKKYALCRRKQ